MRTATRWFAIPIRTSRGSFWLVNMLLDGVAEDGRVLHLAVAHRARGQRRDVVAGDRHGAVHLDLGGRDAVGLDVQADDAALAADGLREGVLSPGRHEGLVRAGALADLNRRKPRGDLSAEAS